jgi:hypothetical protein
MDSAEGIDPTSVPLPVFRSVLIAPNQPKRVSFEHGATWSVTHIGFAPGFDAQQGRTVVWAQLMAVDCRDGKPTAIAALTVGKWETATVDFEFYGDDMIDFSITGSPLPVVISGNLTPSEGLRVRDPGEEEEEEDSGEDEAKE